MAIAFVNASSTSDATPVGSITFSHTPGANTTILIVATGARDGTADDRQIATVTYNGVGLTKIREDDNSGSGHNSSLWYLLNPPTEVAHDVVVTNTSGGTVTFLAAGAMSYSGTVTTGTPYEGATGATDGGSASENATVAVSNSTVGAMIVAGAITGEAGPSNIAPGTNTNERFEEDVSATASDNLVGGDEGPIASATTTTINWTWTGNENWAITAAALVPSGGTPSVNTSESVAVSESRQLQVEHFINKSESVTVTESVSSTVAFNINVSDSATLTESTNQILEHFVNKTDSVTLTENATVFQESVNINVSESVTLTESTGLLVDPKFVNVSDSVTITEAVTVEKQDSTANISVSESITITESVATFTPTFSITVSESISVTESYTVEKPAIPSVDVGVALNTHTVSVGLKSTPQVSVALPTSNVGASLDDYAINVELFNPALTVTLNSYTISVEMKSYSILVDLES